MLLHLGGQGLDAARMSRVNRSAIKVFAFSDTVESKN
jgi:hypothetical protein